MTRTLAFVALVLVTVLPFVACHGEQHIYTEWDTCRDYAAKVAKDAAADASLFEKSVCPNLLGWTTPDAGATD